MTAVVEVLLLLSRERDVCANEVADALQIAVALIHHGKLLARQLGEGARRDMPPADAGPVGRDLVQEPGGHERFQVRNRVVRMSVLV